MHPSLHIKYQFITSVSHMQCIVIQFSLSVMLQFSLLKNVMIQFSLVKCMFQFNLVKCSAPVQSSKVLQFSLAKCMIQFSLVKRSTPGQSSKVLQFSQVKCSPIFSAPVKSSAFYTKAFKKNDCKHIKEILILCNLKYLKIFTCNSAWQCQ